MKKIIIFLFINVFINGIKSQNDFIFISDIEAINDLCINNDTLYIATNNTVFFSNINKYQLKEIKNINKYISVIKFNSSNIWFGTNSSRIGILGKNEYTLKRYDKKVIKDIIFHDTTIWVIDNDIKVFKCYFNNKTIEKKSFCEKDGLKAIYIDSKKKIWLGGLEGIYLINKNDAPLFEDTVKNITCITEYKNSLWVASETEIWRYKNYKKWELFIDKTYKLTNIKKIVFDKTGSLWILADTLTRYIKSLSGEDLVFYRNKELNDEKVDIEIDSNNTVWLANKNGIYAKKQELYIPTKIKRKYKDALQIDISVIPRIESSNIDYAISPTFQINSYYKNKYFETMFALNYFAIWDKTDNLKKIKKTTDINDIVYKAWVKGKYNNLSLKLGRMELLYNKLLSSHKYSHTKLFYNAIVLEYKANKLGVDKYKVSFGFSKGNNGKEYFYNDYNLFSNDRTLEHFELNELGFLNLDYSINPKLNVSFMTLISGKSKDERNYFKYTFNLCTNIYLENTSVIKLDYYYQSGKNYNLDKINGSYLNIEIRNILKNFNIRLDDLRLSLGGRLIGSSNIDETELESSSFDYLYGGINPFVHPLYLNNSGLYNLYLELKLNSLTIKPYFFGLINNLEDKEKEEYIYFQNRYLGLGGAIDWNVPIWVESKKLSLKINSNIFITSETYRDIRIQYSNKSLKDVLLILMVTFNYKF